MALVATLKKMTIDRTGLALLASNQILFEGCKLEPWAGFDRRVWASRCDLGKARFSASTSDV